MKLALSILGGVVAASTLWVWPPGSWDGGEGARPFEGSTFAVRRGDLEITVTENGYLKAKNSEKLKPKYGGQSTITWLIEEGTQVAVNDLLVEFDSTELENDLDETKTRLIQYEAELEAARANLEIQRRDNEAAVEKAELDLDIAKLTLTRFQEGEAKNNLRLKHLEVEKSKNELTRAQRAFEMVPALREEGYLTATQAEVEEIKLREAEVKLLNAEKDLSIYEEYTMPMELRQKEAGVVNADRALLTAKERNDINIKEKEARVSQNERHVKSAKARIQEIEKDLTNMKIHAPRPGIVIYGDPKNSWMTDQIQVGNNIWQGVTVITLPDLSEMQVMVDVHEADINLLELGQPCLVTIDTYKDRTFHGEVTDIASVASSGRWGDATNKQFAVEITLEHDEAELRAGITAKAEIRVETLRDVLQVPVHAVFKDGEDFVCFRPDGRDFVQSVVEIGKSNSHYVVVKSGLDEGDLVLLFDPREESLERGPRPTGEDDEEAGESPALASPGSVQAEGA